MSIPLAKVKTVCTAVEFGVVEASRRPKLGALSLKEAQRYAERARKLQDKWREQSRKQARGQRRQLGSADLASRSQLKEQIFAEALVGFESQVAKLAAKTAGASVKSATKKKPSGGQRATRATARKTLRTAKVDNNAAARRSAAAKKSAAPAKRAGKKPARSLAAKESDAIMAGLRKKLLVADRRTLQQLAGDDSTQQGNLATTAAQQLSAETATKQTRLAQTGLKTRIRGHVSARVRRDQRRRDVHNA
ncbi:MAG: hypothetical protein SGJ19_02155 [Planctomycetia bacterium]|nr:hypothetical protein [Planctomycetia bacterium]